MLIICATLIKILDPCLVLIYTGYFKPYEEKIHRSRSAVSDSNEGIILAIFRICSCVLK